MTVASVFMSEEGLLELKNIYIFVTLNKVNVS